MPEPERITGWPFIAMLALPAIAIGCVTGIGVHSLSQLESWPYFLSVPVCFVIAVIAVGGFIASMGSDFMDMQIGSGIIIVLLAIMFSAQERTRANAERKRERLQLQQRAPVKAPATSSKSQQPLTSRTN